MAHAELRPTTGGGIRSALLVALVCVGAALAGGVTDRMVGPSLASSSPAAFPTDARRGDHHPARRQREQGRHRTRPPASSSRRPMRGEADGAVRRGLTVFDDHRPALANLDPDLLGALRRATAAAAKDGVEILVNSGWRSPAYQDRLLRHAVSQYGSTANAARWVATADTSPHVSGDAVDIGPSRAAAWLSAHGAEYRLCQIYRNEPWHYELRPATGTAGCPPMHADPRHDPRMQP
jgi:D-alanyl-D-alanine carboxypeptidase